MGKRFSSIRCLLDSRCSKSLMSSKLASNLCLPLKQSNMKLVNASSDEMEVVGIPRVWISTPITRYMKNMEIIVSPSLAEDENMLLILTRVFEFYI